MARNVFYNFESIINTDEPDLSETSDEDIDTVNDDNFVCGSDDPSDGSTSSSDSENEIQSENESDRSNSDSDNENEGRIIMGKDNNTKWSDKPFEENRPRARNIIHFPQNRTPNTSNVSTPEDAFLLYIDNKLVNMMIKYTNAEGKKKRGNEWKMMDEIELKAFIGCLIHAGALHQNKHSLDTLFNPADGNPLIRAAFSHNRFQDLLTFLRFDDKNTRSERKERDQFCPIRDFWDQWHKNLGKYFVPGENVTVDEQLVPFRGRCIFLQYMPSKPDKYGMKIFWVCDSETAYPLRGLPYLGKKKTGPRAERVQKGLGEKTVLELTKDKDFKGRNVTCDNYFTTLELAEKLEKQKMTLVGTVKRNKAFLPPKFQQKKALPLYESDFCYRKDSVLISYQSKKAKNVVLLSSMHNDSKIDEGEKKKPEIVLKYNQTKGGVDSMDQMAHSFTRKRKSRRWPLVQFFNILDISTIAARIVYSRKFPNDQLSKPDSRQQFNIKIAKQLVLPQIQRRQDSASTLHETVKNNISAVLKVLMPEPPITTEKRGKASKRKSVDNDGDGPPKKQKRCGFCPANKDRKTKTICSRCSKFVCGEHTVVICKQCAM